MIPSGTPSTESAGSGRPGPSDHATTPPVVCVRTSADAAEAGRPKSVRTVQAFSALRRRAHRTDSESPLWPALVGAALTLTVAFIGMTRPPLWTDEAATISAADRSLRGLIELVSTFDVVHALYYLMMMPWMEVFGTSPLSVRTPSALVLAVGAFLTVRIAMEYARPVAPRLTVTVGLAAGLLFAVLPGLTWMGQEARGFSFGTTCALMAWWSYERWLRTNNDHFLFAVIAAQLLAIYFTLYAAMVVPLYVLRTTAYGWRPAAKAAGAAMAIALGTLPLVLMALPQQGQVSWISTTWFSMVQGMAAKQFFLGYGLSRGPWNDTARALAVTLAGLTTILVLVAIVLGPLRRMQAWLWSWILFPMIVLLAVRWAGGQFYEARYLAFTAPALVVLLALITTLCVPRRSVGMLLLGIVAVLCLPALSAEHMATKNDSDYRSASDFLEPADTIYFMDPASRGITIAYPHGTRAMDPMLAESPEDSGSLWGRNHSAEVAFQQTPSGSVAVVTWRAGGQGGNEDGQGGDHDAVVNHFISTGCTTTETFLDGYNRSTMLDCRKGR